MTPPKRIIPNDPSGPAASAGGAHAIVRLAELRERGAALAGAEAVFWQTAGTASFAGEAERAAYRDLWLGRYIAHAAGEFFLVLSPAGAVIGYLAGSLVSDAPPLPGPDYYALFPPALMQRYPAHLHVNVQADSRSAGVGAALVRAFLDHCRRHGSPGVHAVTAAGSGSAAFFERCGLSPRARAEWRGRELAFLALASAP